MRDMKQLTETVPDESDKTRLMPCESETAPPTEISNVASRRRARRENETAHIPAQNMATTQETRDDTEPRPENLSARTDLDAIKSAASVNIT